MYCSRCGLKKNDLTSEKEIQRLKRELELSRAETEKLKDFLQEFMSDSENQINQALRNLK